MPAKRSGASRATAASESGPSASSSSVQAVTHVHVYAGPPCTTFSAPHREVHRAPAGAAPAESPAASTEPAPEPSACAAPEDRPRRGGTPLRPATGLSRRSPAESGVARPSLPPAASTSGKRYYALLPHHGGPAVVAGHVFAQQELGGSWVGRGRAPSGFASLEDALNHLVAALPDSWRAENGAWSIPVRFQ